MSGQQQPGCSGQRQRRDGIIDAPEAESLVGEAGHLGIRVDGAENEDWSGASGFRKEKVKSSVATRASATDRTEAAIRAATMVLRFMAMSSR